MGDDQVNKYLGRKPLSLDLAALGAGDWIVWDTMELIAFFGIPDGMHLVLDLITFSSEAADAGNGFTFAADFVDDDDEDPRADVGLTPDILSRNTRGIWFHVINAANTAVAMTPVDIYNTFALQDAAGGTGSAIIFWFHYEEGGMDFSQENRAQAIEVRQIDDDIGAGNEYFEVDFVEDVYIGGS